MSEFKRTTKFWSIFPTYKYISDWGLLCIFVRPLEGLWDEKAAKDNIRTMEDNSICIPQRGIHFYNHLTAFFAIEAAKEFYE